jgi:hypothetical protein
MAGSLSQTKATEKYALFDNHLVVAFTKAKIWSFPANTHKVL